MCELIYENAAKRIKSQEKLQKAINKHLREYRDVH